MNEMPLGAEIDRTVHYPVKIRAIHQIELTSRCNLQCKYCLQPYLTRKKEDMSEETFLKCINAVHFYAKQGTQQELWLHGLGESTIHKNFIDFLDLSRQLLPNLPIRVSTNAVGVTEDVAKALKHYKIPVHISLHRPDLAVDGIFNLLENEVIEEMGLNPLVNASDWLDR